MYWSTTDLNTSSNTSTNQAPTCWFLHLLQVITYNITHYWVLMRSGSCILDWRTALSKRGSDETNDNVTFLKERSALHPAPSPHPPPPVSSELHPQQLSDSAGARLIRLSPPGLESDSVCAWRAGGGRTIGSKGGWLNGTIESAQPNRKASSISLQNPQFHAVQPGLYSP